MNTPRTDAAEKHAYEYDDDMTPVVESKVARQLERELAVAREQRDKLAEAVESFLSQQVAPLAPLREALAAVKGVEPEDPHKYCRGGGGNNFHCGCKYDAQNHESYYP
jgi:hypothetical protein